MNDRMAALNLPFRSVLRQRNHLDPEVGMRLQLRIEWYNLFNRVMFGVPARTVQSGTPMGRITGQRNPFNYVNAFRENGSRMGQFSLRLIF